MPDASREKPVVHRVYEELEPWAAEHGFELGLYPKRQKTVPRTLLCFGRRTGFYF
jgi:hypothetical protein